MEYVELNKEKKIIEWHDTLDRLNMVDHKPFKEYDLLTASFFTWR